MLICARVCEVWLEKKRVAFPVTSMFGSDGSASTLCILFTMSQSCSFSLDLSINPHDGLCGETCLQQHAYASIRIRSRRWPPQQVLLLLDCPWRGPSWLTVCALPPGRLLRVQEMRLHTVRGRRYLLMQRSSGELKGVQNISGGNDTLGHHLPTSGADSRSMASSSAVTSSHSVSSRSPVSVMFSSIQLLRCLLSQPLIE